VCMPPAAIDNAMQVTLETQLAIRREFGCSTILGVTNAGFGMPAPGLVDQTFIMVAMAAGLDVVLAVHDSPPIPLLYASALAMDFQTGRDPHGEAYIAAYRADRSRFGVS